jgi:hypothetical protein
MIYTSGIISLLVQFIVGIIDYYALTIPIGPNDVLLRDLLSVELFVQSIEFIFYVWMIYFFHKVSKNITPVRYIDWSITTPLMLITLVAYLKHDGMRPTRLREFINEHSSSIVKIVLLNASMLGFGLLGELGILNPYTSTALGFIPFALNFKYIKDTFLPDGGMNSKNILFYWFVFFWSLYGVFAVMSYTIKNTGYNILDIFAKNFFGVFLAYVILSRSNNSKLNE